MKDRIAEIIKNEHLTPTQFAEKTGIQRAALSHILNERNRPSLEVVMKIHKAFPYINLEWLFYGKEEMQNRKPIIGEKQPDLFSETALNSYDLPTDSKYLKETEIKTTGIPVKEIVNQEVRYIDKPQRKITEIRIFFDDNTYEIFKPEK